MTFNVGVLGVVFVGILATGCGPGLGHHGVWAQSPASSTTVTSAPIQLHVDRADPWGGAPSTSAAPLDTTDPWSNAAPAPVAHTWGSSDR